MLVSFREGHYQLSVPALRARTLSVSPTALLEVVTTF